MVRNRVGPAVGIDLGTTYSCVGVWQDGRVEIITNSTGNRIMPSYVAFTPDQRLVGDAARLQAARNAPNTVFDAKRLIGRQYSDPEVQADMKTWPFKVVKGSFNKPMVSVSYQGRGKTVSAEDISSQVLAELKRFAEEYLDARVEKAVITVPAYFNDGQRQATKDAGQMAGLEVMRIINEPTAAALAYGLQKQSAIVRNVLVFDVGGGTCDVSVLRIDGDDFRVLATDGDTHLGGEDFDHRIVEDLAEEFKNKTGIDVSRSSKSLRKLRTAAEVAKRTLSTATTADIEVDALHSGVDFHTSMTRTRLEDLCRDLFQRCVAPVQTCLRAARLTPGQVADVVLVGGSSRIPKIQQLLREVFPNKDLYKGVNADEAVAVGAAIQAAVMTQQDSCPVVHLQDVTPLSMGIDTDSGRLAVLIPRNTPTPHTAESVFSTAYDDQTIVTFPVYEGERKMSKDNHLLDKFSLSDIPSCPRGRAKFDVAMRIDADGILSVSASLRGSDNWKSITVKSSNGRLSQEEMASIVMDAEIYRREDEAAMRKVRAKQELEDYTYNLRDALKDDAKLNSLLGKAKKKELLKVVKQTLEWLQGDLADVQMYEAGKKVLERKLQQALPDNMAGYPGGKSGSESERLDAMLKKMANL